MRAKSELKWQGAISVSPGLLASGPECLQEEHDSTNTNNRWQTTINKRQQCRESTQQQQTQQQWKPAPTNCGVRTASFQEINNNPFMSFSWTEAKYVATCISENVSLALSYIKSSQYSKLFTITIMLGTTVVEHY